MGWTKEDIAKEALAELTLPSYTFDLLPDDVIAIIVRLDMMMSEWDMKGIRLGYPLSDGPRDSWAQQPSGIPDSAMFAVLPNLAVRIGEMFGRIPGPTLKATAKATFETLTTQTAKPIAFRWPSTMPFGAGNKPYRTSNRQFAGNTSPSKIPAPATQISFTEESS